MSVATTDGRKALLPRNDLLWGEIEESYAKRSAGRWKWLGAFALREVCGWNHSMLSRAFGFSERHVARQLDKIRTDLQDSFIPGRLPPNELTDGAGI